MAAGAHRRENLILDGLKRRLQGAGVFFQGPAIFIQSVAIAGAGTQYTDHHTSYAPRPYCASEVRHPHAHTILASRSCCWLA
jgi:hypothetical protein